MSDVAVIALSLMVLGLCIAYWEWRHEKYGWGRGWMRYPRKPPRTRPRLVMLPPYPFDDDDLDLPLPQRTGPGTMAVDQENGGERK